MLKIDGSFGEGGGQIVRSALALAIVTGKPVRIEKIRAGRKKSGLLRQHLTAVRAASEICGARVEGDEIGSNALSFTPGPVAAGEYYFAIGTAGSTTLVLQTILIPLLMADTASRVTLEGGTHNPLAPPFEFLAKAYLPLVNRMGPKVTAQLRRHGFFPAGGGCIVVDIEPTGAMRGIELTERGPAKRRKARALVAHLPRQVGEREARVVCERLGWSEAECEVSQTNGSSGPGNVVMIELAYENVTEVFTGFGEAGRAAETVATEAVEECRRYLNASAPAGEHLTDQLLLPLAVAGNGAFVSTGLTPHALTHIELIRQFLNVEIRTQRLENGEMLISIG